MPETTNKLIGKTARVAVPAGTAAALVLGAAFFIHHNGVHAADGYAAPIDDSSVSALTSLDSAVETVAARVTPAVVNVAVTSRGSGERDASADQDGGPDQGEGATSAAAIAALLWAGQPVRRVGRPDGAAAAAD